MQGILDMDATALAKKLRTLEISSLDAANAYIAHIKKINPLVNCMVEDRFEEARQEAQRADAKLREGKAEGRLFGVPISIKESYDVAGMKTTGGLPYRSKLTAEEDAEVVRRVKAEGAVILGKTNTPVLCFCQETDNKLYGRTNNPWNLSRTAGGSSGGEAALIAAGGAAVGVGSDIGGSIRMPSHFNGVVGFKCGTKQVPGAGHLPDVKHPLQVRMVGFGALAKSVRDARLINEIIADTVPEKLVLDRFKVVVPRAALHYRVDSSTRRALDRAAEILKSSFQVLDEQPPGYHESTLLWQQIMSIDGNPELEKLAFGSKPPAPVREYLKERLFHSSEIHHYFTWSLIASKMLKPGVRRLRQIERILAEGDQRLDRYLADKLVILPVWHTAAPQHGRVYNQVFSPLMTFRRYLPFVCFANTWGLPALVVPVAEDEEGMPIGLQIVSRVGNEDAIFQLGEILEKNMRGYRRAPVHG